MIGRRRRTFRLSQRDKQLLGKRLVAEQAAISASFRLVAYHAGANEGRGQDRLQGLVGDDLVVMESVFKISNFWSFRRQEF